MSKKSGWIVGVLVSLAVIAVSVVVALDPLPGNQVHSNVGRLEVFGVSAGYSSPASFQRDGTGATVKLGEQIVRVTEDRVELSGGRSITIPPTCKRVELRESRGGMVVLLDGVETR